jgi:hypothetical protein
MVPQEGISRSSRLQQPGQYRRWTEVFAFAWETDASRTLQSVRTVQRPTYHLLRRLHRVVSESVVQFFS